MTKEELIDITCRWLDFHNKNPKYITETSKGDHFINGGLQTDLRAFLNSIKDQDDYFEAVDKAKVIK